MKKREPKICRKCEYAYFKTKIPDNKAKKLTEEALWAFSNDDFLVLNKWQTTPLPEGCKYKFEHYVHGVIAEPEPKADSPV